MTGQGPATGREVCCCRGNEVVAGLVSIPSLHVCFTAVPHLAASQLCYTWLPICRCWLLANGLFGLGGLAADLLAVLLTGRGAAHAQRGGQGGTGASKSLGLPRLLCVGSGGGGAVGQRG